MKSALPFRSLPWFLCVAVLVAACSPSAKPNDVVPPDEEDASGETPTSEDASSEEPPVMETCPDGDMRCGETCRVIATDPLNCGECANLCPDVPGGMPTCTDGVCGTVCGSGTTECGSGIDAACVDTTNDPAHCGVCGHACDPGSACVDGACVAGCPAPNTLCGAAPTQTCIPTDSDPAHCGDCMTSCPAPTGGVATCTDGTCGLACTGSDRLCGSGASAICVRVATDAANCGACGNVCPSAPHATPTCSGNTCGLVCHSGFTACTSGGATSCVDTGSDSANCGGCGNACSAGNACTGGECVSTCVAPRRICGPNCLDVSADDANCGACGTTCRSTETCRAGNCERTHYRVFVSSRAVTPGTFGGIAGADAFCQGLADAVTLGGTWKAWVSTPTSSPSTRFTRGTLPYRLLNGTQIAADYASLTGLRGLDAPINLTELGLPPTYTVSGLPCAVYTASYAAGTFVRWETLPNVFTNSCNELTSSANLGSGAHLVSLAGTYTASLRVGGTPEWSYQCQLPGCDRPLGVYCFEQ